MNLRVVPSKLPIQSYYRVGLSSGDLATESWPYRVILFPRSWIQWKQDDIVSSLGKSTLLEQEINPEETLKLTEYPRKQLLF